MLIAFCNKCKKEIEGMGAVLGSPPDENTNLDGSNNWKKYHLCKECWLKLMDWLFKP